MQQVREASWLPGALQSTYGLGPLDEAAPHIAAKEHVARRVGIHPSRVRFDPQRQIATCDLPAPAAYPLRFSRAGDEIVVTDDAPDAGVVEDGFRGLYSRFVRKVIFADEKGFAALGGAPRLYLANHQTLSESLLSSTMLGRTTGSPVVTLVHAKLRADWFGEFLDMMTAGPLDIRYFDPQEPRSLFDIAAAFQADMSARGKSVLVHVQGARARSCREPLSKLSALFVELALKAGVPVVPMRFVGGLPVEPVAEKLVFPVGYGAQDIYLGKPISPDQLRTLSLVEQKALILGAIEGLGPRRDEELPHEGDENFGRRVAEVRRRCGGDEGRSAIIAALQGLDDPSEGTRALLRLVECGAREAEDSWLGRFAGWLRSGSPKSEQ
jgi:1-acyl-sn-glycerol-3-phosphate acyltransferase